MKSFDPELSREVLVASVKMAAKVPLNAVRMAENRGLTEQFEKTLTSILALLEEREDIKVENPMT